MKLYKLKDKLAIFWFFILLCLQYNKYYKVVMLLLFIGMIFDLIITITNIGEFRIPLYYLNRYGIRY